VSIPSECSPRSWPISVCYLYLLLLCCRLIRYTEKLLECLGNGCVSGCTTRVPSRFADRPSWQGDIIGTRRRTQLCLKLWCVSCMQCSALLGISLNRGFQTPATIWFSLVQWRFRASQALQPAQPAALSSTLKLKGIPLSTKFYHQSYMKIAVVKQGSPRNDPLGIQLVMGVCLPLSRETSIMLH
jgi:hypothetical protein